MANTNYDFVKALRHSRFCARLAILAATTSVVVSAPRLVVAQSAADKATARKLATAGIKLYEQGQFDEALDKLKRAQALYDAPVHLIYMARCQVKLGLLVDGAESYRKLVRSELDDKSPDVFKQAVADGEKELAEVEPRIPALTINVDPSSVAGLEIKLDGEPVSAAVLGVERPVNPGQRTVVAAAPGYLTAESAITLNEGESQQISLTLEVDPNAPKPSEQAPAVAGAVGPGQNVPPENKDPSGEEVPLGNVGFFVGLRGGALFPSGDLESGKSTSDYMGMGGGGELQLGVRFLRNFGVKLFFDRYSLFPGTELDKAPTGLNEDEQFEVTSRAYSTSFGFSAVAGTQRGRIGGQGELGLALSHSYGWDREVMDTNTAMDPQFGACTESETFSGAALRFGGAFVFPVHHNFQLSAFGTVTLGNFSKYKLASNCNIVRNGVGSGPIGESEADVANKGLHQQFVIGVGGDFLFGPG